MGGTTSIKILGGGGGEDKQKWGGGKKVQIACEHAQICHIFYAEIDRFDQFVLTHFRLFGQTGRGEQENIFLGGGRCSHASL